MTLKIDIISKDTIKSSSPTPHHLKNMKLSLIDQYAPQVPVSFILFYTAADNHKHKQLAHHLKASLTHTLTYFYPLAGRINDNNLVIDCSDEGINFMETRVHALLNQVVNNPVRKELAQLLSLDDFSGQGPKVLLSAQLNLFDCGGIALGVTMSHKLVDGSSFHFFLKVWSEVSMGEKVLHLPKFDMSTLFPPKVVPMPMSAWPDTLLNGGGKHFVMKRFVFDPLSVAALKAKCSNKSYVEHPTRVEAVTALIWRCAMNTLRSKHDSPNLASVVSFAVNLRPLITQPLSNCFFGNNITATLATSSSSTGKHSELHCLVGLLRQAKRKVDTKYVSKLDFDAWRSDFIGFLTKNAQSETYSISNLCKLPLYELDFGWGTPTWACFIMVLPFNAIHLVDTKCGNGVEAWITLSEQDMARFESEPDLIAFTFTNKILENSHLIGELKRAKI